MNDRTTGEAASIIQETNPIGSVVIADEVVAIIAGLAATEVEGVASMADNISRELVARLGMKNLSKGVRVEILDGEATVYMSLNIRFGYSIPQVSAKVQEKVAAAIENMVGMHVAGVNIKIAAVIVDKN